MFFWLPDREIKQNITNFVIVYKRFKLGVTGTVPESSPFSGQQIINNFAPQVEGLRQMTLSKKKWNEAKVCVRYVVFAISS